MTTNIIIDDLGSIRQLRRTVDTKDTDGYILSQLRYPKQDEGIENLFSTRREASLGGGSTTRNARADRCDRRVLCVTP